MPMRLVDICANADHWGVAAAAPWPRPGAPTMPFRAAGMDWNENERYAVLHLEREDKNLRDGLIPNDLLMQLRDGVTARVVERIEPFIVRIEAWTPPDGDAAYARWKANPGGGAWVVWGMCWKEERDVPLVFRRREVITSDDIDRWNEAIGDIYPEIIDKGGTLAGQYGNPGSLDEALRRLPRKQRRQILRNMRKLMGKIAKIPKWEAEGIMDDIVKAGTIRKGRIGKGKDEIEVIDWRPPPGVD